MVDLEPEKRLVNDDALRELLHDKRISSVCRGRKVPVWDNNEFPIENAVRFGFINDEIAVRIILIPEKLSKPPGMEYEEWRGVLKMIRRKYAEHEELKDVEYFPYALVKFNPDNCPSIGGFPGAPEENFRRILMIRDMDGAFDIAPPEASHDVEQKLVRWDHGPYQLQVSKKLYDIKHMLRSDKSMLVDFLEMEVDGQHLFRKLRALILSYVDVEDWVATMVALWIIGTHVHTVFSAYPYCFLHAEKGSGKSRVLKIATLTSHVGEFVSNPTAASVFRGVELTSCTLCIDEGEKLADKDAKEINAALNSGYEKGPSVPRWNNEKGTVEYFSPYSPKIIASIEPPPSALESRCLRIPIKRTKRRTEYIQEPYDDTYEFNMLQKQLVIWAIDSGTTIASMDRGKIARQFASQFDRTPPRLIQIMLPILVLYEYLGLKAYAKDLAEIIAFQSEEQKASSIPEDDAPVLVATFEACDVPVLTKLSMRMIIEHMNLESKEEKTFYNPKRVGRILKKYNVPKREIHGAPEYFPGLDHEKRMAFMQDILDRYSIDMGDLKKESSPTPKGQQTIEVEGVEI